MEFVEGRIEEDKMFGDVVFPKTLFPSNSCTGNLAETVRKERDFLAKMLQQHGAILFRGFHVHSPKAFDHVVQAFGWEHLDYFGGNERIRFTDRVYSVNEAPPEHFINFHHEMALVKQSPSKLFFFCREPAPEGGATSIVLSNVVVDKMEERQAEIMAKISESGMIFRIKTARDDGSGSGMVTDKTWKCTLRTDDEEEAKKRVKEHSCCSCVVSFNQDGSAELAYGPMNPIREFGGKRAWFVPILGYKDKNQGVKSSFGDGTEFPSETLSTYRDILEENCIDVKWQRGDVLLLDNYAVQHARRPGKPPRVILMSGCK